MARKGGRKTCRGCERWEEVKKKMRIVDLLEKTAANFKPGEGFKPTLAEYLKLIQLEKEFEEEETKEIKVTWVDPGEASKKSA